MEKIVNGIRYLNEKSYVNAFLERKGEKQLCMNCGHEVALLTEQTNSGLRCRWLHRWHDKVLCQACWVPCECTHPRPSGSPSSGLVPPTTKVVGIRSPSEEESHGVAGAEHRSPEGEGLK